MYNEYMKLLLLEDDRSISHSLKYILENEEYQVDAAFSVQEAERLIDAFDYHLYILDVRLPDGSGFDICSLIRAKHNVPIIFLSVEEEEESIIEGLTRGGDDYLIKPFRSRELLIRIQKLLTKYNSHAIQHGSLFVDLHKGCVMHHQNLINLSPIEYRVLIHFMNHKNELVKREDLYDLIWDSVDYINDNALSVMIKRLRAKFMGDLVIETVRGKGYRYIYE